MKDFTKWVARLGDEIRLLEVNYFQTTGRESTELHTHLDQLHIACFERGKGTFTLNGITRKVQGGMVYVIYPGELHQFSPDEKEPYRACFLHLSWFGSLPTDLPTQMRLPRGERVRFFRLCRELAICCRRDVGRAGGEFMLYSLLLRFFGEMLRIADDESSDKDRLEMHGLDKALNPVVSALHGPPFFYPGIDALAEKTGMSRRKLTTLFRKHIGCGIKEYFLGNVMRYAGFMRQNGEYSAARLARQCGYSTTQNFLLAYRNYLRNHPDGLASPRITFWQPTPEDDCLK